MRVARTAKDFGSNHVVGIVGSLNDRRLGNGLIETRPPAMAIEFGIALKEQFAAGLAVVIAIFEEEVVPA